MWKKTGHMVGDLYIEKKGNKRRLVNSADEVILKYEMND